MFYLLLFWSDCASMYNILFPINYATFMGLGMTITGGLL